VLELEPRLLQHLAAECVERLLVLVEETAGKIPQSCAGVDRPASQQHTPVHIETDRLGGGHGVRIADESAGATHDAAVGLLDSLATDGTELPAVQGAHGANDMSPRAAGATQHELSRIHLLASLPGETLAKLAQRMEREEVAAGEGVVTEGEEGDRFYVVLNGLLSVSQESRGAQRVLRPGAYFGEVALAMDMPRTASVRALTPVTVASCDRATFDEFIRPLFADDAK
jgi:cyclic nucleotide-binding protein